MNIFVLDRNPEVAAVYHCNEHTRKMIVEYAQMLSTSHRILDGSMEIIKLDGSNRSKKVWNLPDERQDTIYKATHYNHPCAKWVRESSANYTWLLNLLTHCIDEFEYRFGKVHATSRILKQLSTLPDNIPEGKLTEFAQAMPDEYRDPDAVIAYHNFYRHDKVRFATWKRRPIPYFMNYENQS